MKKLLQRLRGAVGLGALGAGGLTLYAAIDVAVQSLASGIWPSLSTLVRIGTFTTTTGALVGLLTAGAIALGARSRGLISKTRAFVLGLPIGAVGGFIYAAVTADLPLSGYLFNAAMFGLAAGGMGVAAIAIAQRSPDRPGLEQGAAQWPEITPTSEAGS